MSRRTLALLAALLVLGLCVAWIARTDLADERDAAHPAAQSHVPAPGATPVELVAPIGSTDAEEVASARSTAPITADAEITGDARWIEGRVEFPPGTPSDERAFVETHGAKLGGSRDHRFEVAGDGTFRAAFAAGSKSPTITLVARYAYLDGKQDVDLSATAPLVLRPQLGGCLRVTLAPTEIARARGIELSKAVVRARAWTDAALGAGSPRSNSGDAQGLVEIGGLAPKLVWSLGIELTGFQPRPIEAFEVEPGRVLERAIVMLASPRFRGTVRDARGVPVRGAKLRTDFVLAVFPDTGRAVRSGEAGEFEVFANELGRIELVAELADYVDARVGPFDAKEGDAHDGLEIVLEEGSSIRGFVRWPDGTPASGAQVEVDLESGAARGDCRSRSARTEADGAFEFRGLAYRAFDVSATSPARVEPGADPKARRAEWTGSRASVRAGVEGVEIVLRAGSALRGRVVDDLGAPARGFEIVAELLRSGARGTQTAKASDARGHFELDSMPEGEWKIHAVARTGEPSIDRFVVLPRDMEQELEFVLARPAVLRGRVVDIAGVPAVGARVVVAPQDYRFSVEVQAVETDDAGRFRFDAVAALPLSVHAEAEGIAPSPTVAIIPSPGETRTIELALRAGGTILGRVLDEHDRPRANVRVLWSLRATGSDPKQATTQADGTFRFEAVAAGPSQVTVREDPDATIRSGTTTVTTSGEVYGILTADLQIEDGQVVHVELGGSPKGAIRVRGVVRAKDPVAGAEVHFFPLADASAMGTRQLVVQSDDSGRYEVHLTDAGTYVISASADGMGSVHGRVEITSAPEQVVDVAFGTGRIRGIVLDPDGKPLARVRVAARKEDRDDSDHVASSADCETGEDGLFAFGGLTAGVYSLVADADPYGPFGMKGFAPARVKDLALAAGQERDGLELRIERGCSVIVKVVDAAGIPVANARVESEPRPEFRMPPSTDSAGMVRLDGLSPGQLTLSARTASDAEREPVRVVATKAGTAEARITVVPGGRIALHLERSDGIPIAQPFGYPIEVRDAEGNVWSTVLYNVRDGGVLEYGPMRPGVYRVSARFGAKRTEGVASVQAGAESALVLREPK